jgi:hypothetical protein
VRSRSIDVVSVVEPLTYCREVDVGQSEMRIDVVQ